MTLSEVGASATPTEIQTPTANESSAAASSAPVPSAAAATFDACALLTTAEISAILGAEGVQAKAMPSGGWIAGQCAWNGPASGFFVSVGTAASIKDFGDPSGLDAMAKFAQFTEQAGSLGTAKELPGIGDGAVLGAMGIAAYAGDTFVQVTNLGLTEDQLIEIAKLAVARL